jgi:uncharacterized protein YdhG (YjbR/CyaY superfamily)
MRTGARNIDEYIDGFPPDVQKILQKIRLTIRKEAPNAEEAIKYQIPTFVLNGNLIFFAGFKNHVSVYPAPRGDEKFKRELAAYEGGKGTVRFPLDKPVPFDLIRRIVRFLIKKNSENSKPKRKKP